MSEFQELIQQGMHELGISITTEQGLGLLAYWRQVQEGNRRLNLTRITGDEEAARKHFVDSLSCLLTGEFVPGRRVVDVGSGAGFPGVPLRICCPGVHLTLLDARRKRTEFLRQACAALHLDDIQVIHGRAEELAASGEWRAAFDIAVARALAGMEDTVRWCLPLVRGGGYLVAMRGPRGVVEAEAAAEALDRAGGRIRDMLELQLPAGAGGRVLVTIEKIKSRGGSAKSKGKGS